MAPGSAPRINLRLDGITKVYPGVIALNAVSMAVRGGEILGLIGENGAGKSTLMKILGGATSPDAGQIRIDGRSYDRLTPAMASATGIAFVHQELNSLTNLDVAGNVLLGRELWRGPFRMLDRKAMAQAVQPVLDLIGAHFSPSDPVARLSVADRQLVEIARALSMNARLVILDEPTSSLTLQETQRLLDGMRGLKSKGVGVLFISHRLAEIEAVCDRVIALRDGRLAGELTRDRIDRDRMVGLMIGRDLSRVNRKASSDAALPALELRDVRTAAFPDAAVNLTVSGGEIVGLAGLVGAGRSELARTIFGIDRAMGGEVRITGKVMPLGSVALAMARRVCLVPEDRKQQGLFLDFSLSDNVAMPNLARLSRGVVVDRRRQTNLVVALRERLSIKAPSIDRAVVELSGGNQQKVVLAKWLAMQPRVIILDEPTRGIDVGAKAEIYGLMQMLASEGVAILMISSDMEEVIGVSDRVAVMARGRIAGILESDDVTEDRILRLAIH